MRKLICLLALACLSLSISMKTYANKFASPGDITSLPTASASSSEDTVCAGEIIYITVTLTGTGPWDVVRTVTVNGGFPETFTDSAVADYIYTFPVRINEGNNVFDITEVTDEGSGLVNTGNVGGSSPFTVYGRALPTVSGSVSRSAVCPGQTVDISLNFTGTGPWIVNGSDSVTGGSLNTYMDTIPVSLFSFQAIPDQGNNIYNIIYIKDMATGCENIGNMGGGAPINVIGYGLPTASGTAVPGSVCLGQPVDINMIFTGTGPWSVIGTDSVTGSTLNIYSDTIPVSSFSFPAIPDLGNNIYNIIYIKDMATGCENFGNVGGGAPVTVVGNVIPEATGFITQNSVCLGQPIDINLNFTGTGPWLVTGTDSVTGGSLNTYTNTIPTAAFSFQAIPDQGNNIYNIINVIDLATGCENHGNTGGGSPLSINVAPLPDILLNGFHSSDSVCEGAQISLGIHFQEGIAPYTIQFKDQGNNLNALFIHTDTTILLNFPTEGIYSYSFLSLTDQSGCVVPLNYHSDISVFVTPQVVLNNFTPVCDTIEKVLLTQGTPAGGIYSGRGVYGQYFYPGVAGGPGSYSITYKLQNGPCTDSKTKAITVNLCRNLSISENEGTGIQIYPNPTDRIVNINIDHINGTAELQILNIQGQVVFLEKIDNQCFYNKQIDLGGFTKGIYFIKITSDQFIRTEKLIIK